MLEGSQALISVRGEVKVDMQAIGQQRGSHETIYVANTASHLALLHMLRYVLPVLAACCRNQY